MMSDLIGKPCTGSVNRMKMKELNTVALRLAPIFQSGAVLQRDIMVPVWGQAGPGSTIRVECAGYHAETRSDGEGNWFLRLPPLPVGGPYTLSVCDERGERQELDDILVGDVWVCSGQSNMEFQLCQVDEDGSQSHGADCPRLRLLTVGTAAGAMPQKDVAGRWQAATPESILHFSAVGGWFGRSIHQELNIPIGLIANAWGGTRIQAWLSREALMRIPETRVEIPPYERQLYGMETSALPSYPDADAWFRAEGPENPDDHGAAHGWHLPACDDTGWESMKLPCRWQDAGHDFNGVFWFRRRVTLPAAWRGKHLLLRLGAIDKHDETWVNGRLVGAIGWENRNSWCTPRVYNIPAEVTAADELLIAIRVRSHLYHGGMTGPAPQMLLENPDAPSDPIPLSGFWRYRVEQNWGIVTPPSLASDGRGPGGHNAPYTMFESRVRPLLPYGIRGWLWYQGEANTQEAGLYRKLLPALIEEWRRAWGQGDLPFLVVQLAAYLPPRDQPEESAWANLRAAQAAVLRVPGTGLVTAVDVGDADDIHPRDKKTVGLRLARWALCQVYGRGGTPCGPLLRGCRVESGGRMRLDFDHAAGLRTRDGQPVRHLAIAGADGRFRWAESLIEGQQLLVWHAEVTDPVAVRYAWADNPEGSNLINGEGWPAFPFDTRHLEQ